MIVIGTTALDEAVPDPDTCCYCTRPLAGISIAGGGLGAGERACSDRCRLLAQGYSEDEVREAMHA